jgi:gas vesicle protein
VTNSKSKRKSVNFVSGLALGTAVAAAATFLYKTKKGKKVRRQLKHHIKDTQGFLGDHVKDIKKQAKKLETQLEESQKQAERKTRSTQRQVKNKLQATAETARRRVFLKRGKPLAK